MIKDISVIVLAGGLGSRLKSELNGMPKPLANINGQPFIKIVLENWVKQGFRKFIFSLHYKSELIIDFLEKSVSDFPNDCQFSFFVEPKLLGTGGAISYIVSNTSITNEFVVLNSDTWLNEDISKICLIDGNVICGVQISNNSRYGKIEFDTAGLVLNFSEKDGLGGSSVINAGVYKFQKKLFEFWDGSAFSLENNLLPSLVKNKMLKLYLIQSEFIDIGIPEDYLAFCKKFR